MHRSEFLVELKREFPDVREDVNQEHGLLHLEVAAFARRTQRAIDEQDREAVSRAFKLAAKCLTDGDSKLQNAIGVSYLEHLEFRDQKVARSWAYEQMPQSLRGAYRALRGAGAA